jgi:8-oxo-dGTP pyrophosphatase MutT (NUDIX family)
MGSVLHQAGAIAYRVRHAQIEVLLITSRAAGRWIIPKGNIDAGCTPAEAAEREAYEEAGVEGVVGSNLPFGSYTYLKRTGSGTHCPAAVEVYLLQAKKVARTARATNFVADG